MRFCILFLLLAQGHFMVAQKRKQAERTDFVFRQAHYYTTAGVKVTGYIDTLTIPMVMSKTLVFSQQEGALPEFVSLSGVRSIVTEKDSLIVFRNLRVEGEYSGANVTIPISIARLIESGSSTLYQAYFQSIGHRSGYTYNAGPGGGMGIGSFREKGPFRKIYVLAQPGTGKLISVEMGIEDFIKQMVPFFVSSPEICDRIRAREYSYFKVSQLVRDYNEWQRNQNP